MAANSTIPVGAHVLPVIPRSSPTGSHLQEPPLQYPPLAGHLFPQ